MRELTEKERNFCKAYLDNDFNALDAALSVGYRVTTEKQAFNLLKRSEVRDEVRRLQALQSNQVALSRAWVIKEAMELYRLAKADKAWSPAAKTLQMLGAEVGALQEKREATGTITVEHLLKTVESPGSLLIDVSPEKPASPENQGTAQILLSQENGKKDAFSNEINELDVLADDRKD